MSGIRNNSGSTTSRRKRVIKVTPMTRAVRMAMAASLAALALGASSGAFAAGCKAPSMEIMPCTSAVAPVIDLTLVPAAASHQTLFVPVSSEPNTIMEYSLGDVVIDNADPISESDFKYSVTAISGYSSEGSVEITNQATGVIEAISILGSATGIEGYAYGDVGIHNAGDIYVGAGDSAIGLYGYSIAGNVSIDNSAGITAYSYSGLADGIFASGTDVDVTNSGAVEVYGSTWAAGIEAQGYDSAMVTNSGDINVQAPGFQQVYAYSYVYYDGGVIGQTSGSHAYGIYATGGEGGVQVGNSGNIEVDAGYATGIEVQSKGDVSVVNSGSITAGSGLNNASYYNPYTYTAYSYAYGSAAATGINASSSGAGATVAVTNSGQIGAYGIYSTAGINATSNGEGGSVLVNNSGDIVASGYFNAYGISATATGTGGTVGVTNSGSIYAAQGTKYGYGAYGVFASADGDASVENTDSGSITVYSAGAATGVAALSFAGDASVTNAGDISVNSGALLGYTASGIISFAQNSAASVDNSGSVSAVAGYTAKAVDASGFTGVTVTNSGSLYANGNKYAYGVYASSGTGDVSVTNTADGSIQGYSYVGRGFGVLGVATQGDVMVDNAGSIEVYGYGQSAGVFGVALAGDVSVTNSGDITAITGGNVAVGVFARADNGTASVDNSGDIYASVVGVNDGYIGDSAYGILARGAYADVSNSGSVVAIGLYSSTGINASGSYGDTQVSNSGDIYAGAIFGGATGIYARGGTSLVDNAGAITAVAYGDVAQAIGIANVATYYGNATTTNSGDVTAFARGGLAPYGEFEAVTTGIYNLAVIYDSVVNNSGTVSATAVALEDTGDYYSYVTAKAIGVQATNLAGYGAAIINNTGAIQATSATSQGFSSAWGAVAQGRGLYGDVGIVNDGDISSYAYTDLGTANSFGAYTQAVGGDMTVINHGDIESVAHSERGVLYYVTDAAYATGVKMASPAYYGAGSATLENYGNIDATAYSVGGITGARGVQAYGGQTSITNHTGATISATGEVGLFGAGHATGIEASAMYGIDIVNDGDIVVHGIAHGLAEGAVTYYAGAGAVGIDATANYQGDIHIANNGDINAIATTTDGVTFFNAGAGATGITAYAKYDATVINAGDINAIATSDLGITAAYGVEVHGKYSGNVVNQVGATIHAEAYVHSLATDMYGGRAVVFGTHTFGSDYATTTNSGHIVAKATVIDDGVANEGTSLAQAWGASIGAYSTSLTGTIVNSGDIHVSASADFGYASSYGTFINSQYMASTSNTGLISATASAANGNAFAVGSYGNALHGVYYVPTDSYGYPDYGNVTFTPDDGHAMLTNTGDIVASASAAGGVGNSYGAVLRGAFGSMMTNSGHIVAATEADDAQATAALLVSFYGGSSLVNSGRIQASAEGGLASATGANVIGLDGGVTVGNTGMIIAAAYGADAMATAVRMESNSTNKLVNSGTITALGDGEHIAISSEGDAKADLLNSGLVNGAIQTGSLDDRFVNASGGVWHVENYSTDFGDGNDSIVNNAGGLIDMTYGAISMGAGNDSIVNNAGGLIAMSYSSIYMGAGNDSILNLGVISVEGDNLIDLGSTSSGDVLTNVNSINFLGNSTYDALTIVGNVGGTGAVGLDVDLADHSSDQIQVNGNMVAGAAQHVDILFDGLPAVAHTSIAFAHVTGTSVAGSFVPGQILSYNYPRNFIDLQFSIGSNINVANTAADVFSINLDVAGLLDSGTLAATAATGAAGMLNDQIGTFRQRMGVNPYGDAGKVMSAFFRTYTSEGDTSPDHVAANFGQGGNFDYDHSTWGREVGVNANLFGNFHAGVVLGTANGRQRLTGAGVGTNRMDGMTWGAYATWFAPQGYYVDLSGRWMAVDIKSTSAAGTLQARAHTSAVNLETGYKWTTAGGFNITPQLQYTQTKVEDMQAFDGDRADFENQGGTSSRGRLGVEFSKSFLTSGGMNITPYGSINAIREFDGEMTYTVADNFHGATSTGGTSSMAELGLGIEKGHFAVSAGANWVDGGAFNSVMGGQVIVRFAW